MILAGDLGGTKTVLALFDEEADGYPMVREEVFSSQEYRSFEDLIREFLERTKVPPPAIACFGVAGAVIEGRVHTTNLPWTLQESSLAGVLEASRVKLLNDLEATAYGMLFLRPDEIVPLSESAARRRAGNAGVIAAGTGLGEAILFWDGKSFHPIASEGGHGDFGPRDDLEIDLLQYMRGLFGEHVSYERVLSGPGLHNIYRFFRDRGRYDESPAVAETLRAGDPNATIARFGLEGTDPLCVATLDLFCSLYGAEAGNLALRCVALGGVYIGGGIAPKLLPALRRGAFMKSFITKGRMSEFLRTIEVKVAMNPRAALLGAAHYAERLRGDAGPA